MRAQLIKFLGKLNKNFTFISSFTFVLSGRKFSKLKLVFIEAVGASSARNAKKTSDSIRILVNRAS